MTEISHDQQYYVGHNKFYEQVLVPKIESLMGRMIEVEIVECTKFSMKGQLNEQDLAKYKALAAEQAKFVGVVPKIGQLKANPAKIINQEVTNGTSSCCGNEESGESGCCGGGGGKSKPNGSSCCGDNEKTDEMEILGEERNRVREYAFATICALSAILISKIALRYLFSNR